MLQVPQTVAAMADIGVLNMGDGKREKVCICMTAQNSYAVYDSCSQ